MDEFFTGHETKQITILGNQWIEVKQRLTYGEEKMLAAGALTGMTTGANSQINVDMKRYAVLRIATWVTDWSLTRNGQRAKLTHETIEALNPRVAQAIDEALDAHILEVEEGKDGEIIEIVPAKK